MFAFVYKMEYNSNTALNDLLSIAQFFEEMSVDVINGIFNVITRISSEGWNVYRCCL